MEILYIIILILIIAVIFLIFKISNPGEHFDQTADIKSAVSNQYKVDLDAMRNLGALAQKILQPDESGTFDLLDLPASTINIKNLKVTGNVNFSAKDTNIMEIFPRYMVIAWATNTIPLGWAICDGKLYYPENDNISLSFTPIPSGTTIDNAIITPDLRGRFILGTSPNYNYGTVGGEATVELTEQQMPNHTHFMFTKDSTERARDAADDNDLAELNRDPSPRYVASTNNANLDKHDKYTDFSYAMMVSSTEPRPTIGLTSSTGGDASLKPIDRTNINVDDNNPHTLPHNNMPPYYVLTYIMKL